MAEDDVSIRLGAQVEGLIGPMNMVALIRTEFWML